MGLDLNTVPDHLLQEIFVKMDYPTLTKMRLSCCEIARFVDDCRRKIATVANVYAIRFKGNNAYIQPISYQNAFLQMPEDMQREFPYIDAKRLEFHSLTLPEAIKIAPLLRSRGVAIIAFACNEVAVIHIASVLRPKAFFSQGSTVSENILLLPGMQDVEKIHIKSPQAVIDFTTCGRQTKILMVNLSSGLFPEAVVCRLFSLWSTGASNLYKMQFTFSNEYDSLPICEDLIEFFGAMPVYMWESYRPGPLQIIPLIHFKSPRCDRLILVSNRDSQNPKAGIVFFRRRSFQFEAAGSLEDCYEVLNKYGNRLFKEPFTIDFKNFIVIELSKLS